MDPNSYLQTGIDNSDVLNLQQDTQKRLDTLFQDQKLPSLTPTVPQIPFGKEGVVNPGDNTNVLNDDNFYSQLSQNAVKAGSGEHMFDADNFLSQKDTGKYIDEKFGYTLNADNEDWYAQNQGSWERIGKGLVGFATKTVTDFTKGAGYSLALLNPLNWGKNWVGNASDNVISKISQNVEDKVLQDWLPQYQEASDRGKGIVWRMFHDENFWTEDVVDLAAFTTSAFLTDGMAVGSKVGPTVGKLMTGMKDLETAEGFLTSAGKVANTTDRIAATALNTIGESMFEAKGVRDTVYQNQIDNGADEDTAKTLASKAASNTFFANTALLSLSNYWETGIFFNRLKNTSKAAVELGENTIVDKVAIKAPDIMDKIMNGRPAFYLKKAAEGYAVEGMYEENGQLAISRNATNEYSTKNPKDRDVGFFGNVGNVFSQWYKQTKDAYKGKDEEAFENIFLGGLFGAVMGTGEAWMHKEYSEKKEDAEKVVHELNAAKAEWLKRSDLYTVGQDGKVVFDQDKFTASLYGNMEASTKQQLADYYKNPDNRDILKKDAFSSYALAHFKVGTEAKLLDEIQTINKLTPDQLVKIGMDPSIDDFQQKATEYKNYTNKLKDAYDSIQKHYKYNGADPNVDIYRRDYLYGLAAKQIAFKEQSAKIQTELNDISSKMDGASSSDSLVDELNHLNTRIKIQENNVKLYQDKKYAKRILDELVNEKKSLEADNEDTLKKVRKDSDDYYSYENRTRNKDILAKDLQEGIVRKASMDSQSDNIKETFDKYADNKKGYDAFYEEVVKPEVDSMIKAKDEVAPDEAEQAKPKPEQVQEDNKGNFDKNYYLRELANTSSSARVKDNIDNVEGYKDFLKELVPNIDFNDIDLKHLKDAAASQYILQDNVDHITPVPIEGKSNEEDKDKRQDIPKETEAPIPVEVNKIKGLISSTTEMNQENHEYFKDKIDKALKDGKINQDQYNNIKKVIDERLESEGKNEQAPEGEENKGENEEPDEVRVDDNSGDYNPDALEDELEDNKSNEAQSLVAYMTSNKTVTQEELSDANGYTGKLDEDKYKQFKQNFIREKLSYEGALFQYGAKIVKDNPSIPKEKATDEALKRNPHLLGSVLLITDINGNTLYFDNDYNESTTPKEGSLPIAFSFTDKYWGRDEHFRAALGEKRTQGQISVEEFLQKYTEEAKQRDKARELNNNYIDVPVTLNGFNQGAMQYNRESKTLTDVIGYKPVALLVAGSKDAPTGEKFTYVNGQKLAIGGFYANLDGKYFRSKPRKLTEVKSDIGSIADFIVGATFEKFKTENDAQFVANYISKMVFVNRAGRPEIKIYDNNGVFEIVPILNKKRMSTEDFNNWIEGQYLNIHSDSLGQKIDVPIYAYGIVHHKTIEYNHFIINNTVTNVKGIETSEGTKIMPLNGYLTFDINPSIDEMQRQLDSKNAEFRLPFDDVQSASEQVIEESPKEKEQRLLKESSNDNSSITNEETKENPKFQTFETNEKSAKEIQDEINKFKDDNRLERAKQENQDKLLDRNELEHVKNIFGDTLRLNHLQDIVDANAWGTWTAASITLFKDAPQGTAYHEAWHQFSQLYLTKQEKVSLYKEVRNKVSELKTAPDFEVEEAIAEDFRKYTKGESVLNNRPQRNTIFRRILDYIKKLFFGGVNLSRLYDQLYRGDLKNYTPNINNALFGKLNSKIVSPTTGLEVIDNAKTAYYMNVMDALLGNQLLNSNSSPSVMNNNLKLASYFYDNVKADLIKNYYNKELANFNEGKPYNENLVTDLQAILANWKSIVDYHKEHSKLGVHIEEDIPGTEEDHNPEEDLSNADREEHQEADFGGDRQLFDRKGNEESSIESASEEIRGLIRLLPEVEQIIQDGNKSYKVKLDYNGFPKLNDYSRTWNNLAIELAGDISYERMYAKLSTTPILDKIPEAFELIKRLPNPNNITSPEQRDSAIRFNQAFNKSYVRIISVLKDGQRYLAIEETNRNRDTIQKQWSTNFMSHGEGSDAMLNGYVLSDEQGRNYVNPTQRFNYNFNSQDQINNFLNLLGISISNAGKADNKYKQNIVAYSKALQNSLNQRLSNGLKVSDPVSDLGRDYQIGEDSYIPGVKRVMNALLNIESKYSSTNPSMSYQTAEGEVIYGLSFNNTLTLASYFLNNANTLSQLHSRPDTLHYNPSINPYVTNSVYLNTLFDFQTGKKRLDKYGNPIKLLVDNYNGLKEVTESGTRGKSTANLNQREKMLMDINSLSTSGIDEIMRTESSSSAWAFGLSAYDSTSDKKLPISIESFERGFGSDLTNIWKGYIYDELHRMQTVNSIDLPGYPKEAAKEFNLNYDILNPDLKTKLKEDIGSTKDIISLISKHEKAIDASIVDFFTKETEKLKKRYLDENITKNDLSSTLFKYNFDQLVRSFVANDFIKNVEYTKLINGDTIYQAHYKDYHKRAKGDISTGRVPITDNWFASYMQSREKNTFAGSMGVTGKNDYKRVTTINYKDDIRPSQYHTSNILQTDLKNMNNFLSQEEIDKILKPYADLNIADGQGHITLDFYRQFLISIGNWSLNQDIAYQKELAWFRMNYSDQIPEYSDDKRKADQEFLDKHKDVQGYFPPMKVQYNGPIQATGTYAPVMDKFSVVPLIPSVIKGKNWEKVNLDLMKKGIGYTKFESGTKKFKFTPVDLYKEIDGKRQFSPDLDHATATHFLNYLKEQINTSFKIKEDTRFGSQMRKLIMANVFSNGISSEKYKERMDRYSSILKRFQSEQKEKLFRRIGIEEAKGGFTIKDMNRFVSQIQFEAKRQKLNDNILDYTQYDKDSKGVVYPLESSLNRGPIQDLIMGMIDRELRIHKMNGDMAIQVASSGYEDQDFNYTNPTDEDIKKYGTNGLSFYHLAYDDKGNPIKTNKMQVKVGLVGSFTKLLNRADIKEMAESINISPLKALNKLIKDQSWLQENEKAVSLVGYRIPTQGINSMENMIVQEFLPSSAGSIIIPPAEIVAKSGSDYDIDKLNIFKPSLTEDGQYIHTHSDARAQIHNKINELERKVEELRQGSDYFSKDGHNVNKLISAMFGVSEDDINDIEEDEMKNTLGDIYKTHKELQGLEKGYLSNQIIELYDEVLSDPDMYTQLVTPNSTDLILDDTNNLAVSLGKRRKEDITKGKQGYLRTQIYRAINNYRKFESLLEGKKFLGVFATNNTLSQILQQNDIRTNQSYTHPWTKDVNGKPFKMAINVLLLNNVERRKIIDEKGLIKLGDKYNIEGKLKQDYISQLVNATVDIASNDFIGYINLNWENIGVMNYQLQQGIPYNRIINFINQPILQRYYEMLRKNPNVKPREVQMDLYEELTKDNIPRNKNNGKRNAQFFVRNMQYLEREMVGKYFDNGKMADRIKRVGNKYNDFLYGKETPESKAQIYFLAHFLNVQDQAKQMRNYQSTINFDTNKLVSPIDAYTQLLNRDNVAKIGMFDKSQIDKVLNNSIISVFNNNKIIGDMFQQIMPAAYKEGFLKVAAQLMNETYLSSKDKKRMSKLLVNDFTEFIVKNFGIYDDKSLPEAAASLFVGDKSRPSLAKRAVQIKEKYPDLVDEYNLFDKVFPNYGTRKRKIDNVEINRVFENTVDDQNRYIDEFRKLINFSDHRYTVEQQAEVRKFFKDLALLGFFQSGFNKSPISFQELIPYEQFASIFKEGIYTFQELANSDPKLADGLYKNFKTKFKLNNPKFFNGQGVAEPYRLKTYGIRDEELINRINKALAKNKRLANNQIPTADVIANMLDIHTEKDIKSAPEQLEDDSPDETEYLQDTNTDIAARKQAEQPTKGVELFKGFWTRKFVESQKDKVFLFGDNTADKRTAYTPTSTQAVIRGLPNAIGISTKRDRGTNETSYLNDSLFDAFKKHLDEQIQKAKDSGKTIVIPADGIGTGKAELEKRAPRIFAYLQEQLNKLISGSKIENPAENQIEKFNEQQDQATQQQLEDSPEESLYKEDVKQQEGQYSPQQLAIKTANDYLNAEDYTIGEYLKHNEFYYYPIDKNMSDKQIDSIIEDKSKRIRVIRDNYDYAEKMDKEMGDFISDKRDNITGSILDYYIQDKFDKSYEKITEQLGDGDLYNDLNNKYWKDQKIDVNDILKYYQNELYSNEDQKEQLEDFFKKNKIDPTYNPNQLSLFDTNNLDEMRKQIRDNIDDITKDLNQRC